MAMVLCSIDLAKPIISSLLEAALLKFLPAELVEYNLSQNDTEMADLVQLVSSATRKKVHITTDSVCDLPQDILEMYGIGVVPYYVCTDQGRFRDMNEMTSDNLLEYWLRNGGNVRSEAASIEEYEGFFSDALGIGV